MKQKIFMFVLAFALMLCIVPAGEARAEENPDVVYLNLAEALEILNITWDDSLDEFINGGYLDRYPYFMILSTQDENARDYHVFLTSETGSFVNSGTTLTVNRENGEVFTYAAIVTDLKDNNYNITSFKERENYTGMVETDAPVQPVYFEYANYSNYTYEDAEGDFFDSPNEFPEPHVHVWNNRILNATCDTLGKTWDECMCGSIRNEIELPLLEHQWNYNEVQGSCVIDARTWEECSLCGAIQNEVVTPANGHVWIPKEVPATCISTGTAWEECGCGAVQNETELPLAEHDLIPKEEVGSCIEDTRTWDECSVCGTVLNEVVTPASGHVWVYNENPASCSYEGYSWEECGCGAIQNEQVIPMFGHVYDDDSDSVCNVCSYNRNMEQTVSFLDMLPVILSLFMVFPLNFFLGLNLIMLGIILYRVLKKS